MFRAFGTRGRVLFAFAILPASLIWSLALATRRDELPASATPHEAGTSCIDVNNLATRASAAARPFSAKVELTTAASSPDLIGAAEARIHLAELSVAEGRSDVALQYLDAIDPHAIENPEIDARVDLGKASALLAISRFEDAKKNIRGALSSTSTLPRDAQARIDALTQTAQLLADNPGLRTVEAIKTAFAQISESLADTTLSKHSIARLLSASADLYFATGQSAKSLSASQRAAFAAQEIGNHALEYKANLATGDAYVALSRPDDAIRGYEAAIAAFPSARSALIGSAMLDPKGVRHFAGRAYLALADQLLARAAHNEASAQRDRARAISAMEALKTAELQEFYLTPCAPLADSRTTSNKEDYSIPKDWIVLYPIVFRDRVEVLSLQSDAIVQTTVSQAREKRELVRQLRVALEQHATEKSEHLSDQVYTLLFDQSLRAARNDDGIVYVPDSWLRTVPLAALRAGDQYLIENHPIVTAPSLQSAFASTSKAPEASGHNSQLIAAISESIEGYPALPGVTREVQSIQTTLAPARITSLQNEGFTRTAFTSTLSAGDFSLVHLATHGEFAGRADASFILTHDGAIHVDEFTTTLRGLSGDALDLLVLSACQTATGDDRAALGLGGMAVQVGARDVLATLWQVNDAASAKLIASFYNGAFKANLSFPRALQKAQIELIRSQEFAAPDYWAPYLLIGNAL